MTQHNDKSWGWHATVTILLLAAFFAILAGCNVEKRIAQAKIDAVTLDHALNPCANDTTILTTPGETLVLIDSVTTHTTDTLTQTDTLRTTITITKHRTDTIAVVVVDKRLINDYKDSIAHYKLLGAKLDGINTQLRQTLAESQKRATRLLIWLLSLCVAIVIGIVLWIVIKIRPI